MRKRAPKILMTAVLLASAATARAQATRTWVSGVGDDANPCSRTAPCKTFAGAISKTAAGGEINVLDPGGYGGVTITKAISIIAEGSIAGVLVSGTNAIIVNAGASDMVTLRGLDIDGLGTGLNGIRFLAGAALHVEDCIIYGFTTNAIDFEPSTAGARLFVSNSSVRDNSGGGILVKPQPAGTASGSLENVLMERNAFGLRVEDRAMVVMHGSETSANSGNGVLAFSSVTGATVSVDNSVSSHNGTNGIKSEGANATVRLNDTTVTNNTTGLTSASGGAIVSFGNNHVIGNGFDGAPTSTIGPI